MLEINLPDLETDQVLRLAKEVSEMQIQEPVTVNANMRWVRPFGLLYTVSILKELRKKNPTIPFYMHVGDTNAVNYAAHMGFFKSVSMSISYGKEPGEAEGNSYYLPITQISTNHLQQEAVKQGNYWALGDVIECEAKRLASILSQGNKEVAQLLAYIIREIIRNTPEHAETDTVWMCGQYWRDGAAEIAIMDEGIGILKSLQKNRIHRQYVVDDEVALQSCVKAGISQAFDPSQKNKSNDQWSNSGYGLYVVSQLCSNLSGSFCIASGEKYVHVGKNGKTRIGDTHIQGTAVKMTISVNQLKNAKEVIQKVAMEGQQQAKTIRYAFKHASTPSKGLMGID